MSTSPESDETTILPLLPLRDVVVFPHMVIPLFVGRPKSIKALEAAMEEGKNVVLIAQKSAANDDPTPEDLYDVGSVASILQMLKLPDGTVKVLVEGVHRARIKRVLNEGELRGRGLTDSAGRRRQQRSRGDASQPVRAIRSIRQAQQENSAGSADLAFRH
jgi:ATP-dependent Lon protease